jgi:hypothetical protein
MGTKIQRKVFDRHTLHISRCDKCVCARSNTFAYLTDECAKTHKFIPHNQIIKAYNKAKSHNYIGIQ